MALPWSLPAYTENPEEAFDNGIAIYGFGTELLGGMLIDDSHYLEGEEASSHFYLIPVDSRQSVSYSFASFVADCLAFEHATPLQALPNERSFSVLDVPWTLKPPHREDLAHLYLSNLSDSYSMAADIAEGLWFRPLFKYDGDSVRTVEHKGYDLTHLDYSNSFGNVALPLHFYNTALRQTDPLSQFLHYYRIVENLGPTANGKQWVEAAVTALPDYKLDIAAEFAVFGKDSTVLEQCINTSVAQHIRNDRLNKQGRKYNFAEVMRACAVARLNTLSQTLTASAIATQFWNVNRCGIGHGGRRDETVRRHDIDLDFKEVLADIKVLRYLARVIIEANM